MSDGDPPGEPPDGSLFPEPPPAAHGYAALPRWARILIPAAGVVLLGVIGYVGWQAAQGDEVVGPIEDVLEELADEERTATTTIPPPITSAAAPTSSTTTIAAAAVTTEATSTTSSSSTSTTTTTTTTTVVPTTSTTTTSTTSTTTTTTVARPTTTVARPTTTTPRTTTTLARPTTTRAPTTTTLAPTTTPPTTLAPPTTPPPTTVPPTTEPPTPTTLPPTTPPPTTVPPTPTLPVAPGQVAPSARGFAEFWNANAAGTGVPALTESDITALENGPAATTFIAPLSERVGLVGVVRNDDSSVAEVLLVWIPGGDEAASNQLYRNAFDVLLRTVNPELTADERAELGDELGLTAQAPPFPADETVTAQTFPDRFARFVRDTPAADGTAIISVVDARTR